MLTRCSIYCIFFIASSRNLSDCCSCSRLRHHWYCYYYYYYFWCHWYCHCSWFQQSSNEYNSHLSTMWWPAATSTSMPFILRYARLAFVLKFVPSRLLFSSRSRPTPLTVEFCPSYYSSCRRCCCSELTTPHSYQLCPICQSLHFEAVAESSRLIALVYS